MTLRSAKSQEPKPNPQEREDGQPKNPKQPKPKPVPAPAPAPESEPEPEPEPEPAPEPRPEPEHQGPIVLRSNRSKPSRTRPQGSTAQGKRKRETGSNETPGMAKQANDNKFRLDESQPPLFKLPGIFHDMVLNAWNKTPLKEAMETLSTKQIHVATMCSGTESPLLALDIIKEGKQTPHLSVWHFLTLCHRSSDVWKACVKYKASF